MINFKTETGSYYELDTENRRVRRLLGNEPGTARQAPDGEWQTYHAINNIRLGCSVLFIWDEFGKATVTSPVRTYTIR